VQKRRSGVGKRARYGKRMNDQRAKGREGKEEGVEESAKRVSSNLAEKPLPKTRKEGTGGGGKALNRKRKGRHTGRRTEGGEDISRNTRGGMMNQTPLERKGDRN